MSGSNESLLVIIFVKHSNNKNSLIKFVEILVIRAKIRLNSGIGIYKGRNEWLFGI